MPNYPQLKQIYLDCKHILLLSGPLIANNLALAGMGFADTVMSGRLSALDLTAVAIGAGIWFIAFIPSMGVLLALSPIAAQLYGAKQYQQIGHYTRQTLWLSIAATLATLIALGLGIIAVQLDWLAPDIQHLTSQYLQAIAWGAPAMFAYLTLRYCSEGTGWTRPVMYTALLGLTVNVIGNYLLIYGNYGFPKLGAVGCGWASAISMWCMFFMMLAYIMIKRRYKDFAIFSHFEWPDYKTQKELIWLGAPIGFAMGLEISFFSIMPLLMGKLGETYVAAHQIAINYAGTMFMIPMGLAFGTTIYAGQTLGGGNASAARRQGFIGILLCGLVMAISAVIMLLYKSNIVGLYTKDPEVMTLAISLVAIAMVFQVSDGLQVGALGALRAFKDTTTPSIINFIAYWLLGFPIAYYFGIYTAGGVHNIWIAFVVALSFASCLLIWRFYLVAKAAQSK